MYAPPPHLNLVVLRSPDIERAAKFYQAMGFLFTRHSHGSGPEHYTSEVNGLVFEIYPMTTKSTPTAGARIGFRVDSVDETLDLLIKAGAEVVSPATDSQWGRRAVMKDLDGHVIELVEQLIEPPIDPRISLTLRVRLKDWTDVDAACYCIAIALGVAPDHGDKWDFWGGKKGMFWSNNPMGNGFYAVLEMLAETGVLEKDEEEMKFRWNPRFDWASFGQVRTIR